MSNNIALLILDAQVNMFSEDESVYEGEKILGIINNLISRARNNNLLIINIQNSGSESDPDFPGTPGWQIHPAIALESGDIVIQKSTPDAFFETPLKSILDSQGIQKLFIAGMQTEICIDATCRRAASLGYDVTLVKDAHSTFDADVPADQIIALHNQSLNKLIEVQESKNIIFDS